MKHVKLWTTEEIEYLKENYSTTSTKDLMKYFNRSVDAITNKAKKYDLKKDIFPIAHNKIREEIENNIIKLYETDKQATFSEIAKQFNVHMSTVDRILVRRGISKNKLSDIQKKYTLNEDYFNIIDTDIKAYILGFIYGDGYNLEYPGRLVITLNERDISVLNLIKTELNFSGPIKKRENEVSLCITSKQLSTSLKKHGIYQNKSLTVPYPTEEMLPEKYRFPFLMGLLDSDGCIYYKYKHTGKLSYPTIIFTGSECMLTSMYKYFKSIGINMFIIKTKTKGHIQLRATNNTAIKFFVGHFLSLSFSLPRKREKLIALDTYLRTNDNISLK